MRWYLWHVLGLATALAQLRFTSSDTPTVACHNAAPWEVCEAANPTVDVILTVYRRNVLAQQLRDVAMQIFRPTQVIVVQNELRVDVGPVVANFTAGHPEIPITVITSTTNTRYHGRFFFAYAMSQASFVSVWDDDVTAGREWLNFSVGFSLDHGDALVGGNGRTLESIGTANHGHMNQLYDDGALRGCVGAFGLTSVGVRSYVYVPVRACVHVCDLVRI